MFRETSPQSSFLEVQKIAPNILPEDDWSNFYREKIYPLIDENKFRHLFDAENGAPNKSVKMVVSTLIFMSMEKLTWREAEFQFRRRLDWQNATFTPLGEAIVDHTTLFKFYIRLEGDDTALDMFQDLTIKFVEICGTSLKKQRTDSFFVHGWLKLLSRYGLLKETIRVFLQNLRKQKPGLYENILPDLSRNYLEKEFDLTEKDRDKTQRQIKEMAHDLFCLYEAFRNHKQVQHFRSFQSLVTVLNQQCKIIESGENGTPEIIIRDKPEGEKIICTPHNEDAQYTKKGKQKVTGHRGFATETCDKDNETQFITDVGLTPAPTADVNELPKSQERMESSGLKPEILYADAGFVNGKTIIDSAAKDILLEGPTSGRSQSFESYRDSERPLDTADFNVSIDETTQELTVNSCPAKQAPVDQSRSTKTGMTIVHFSPDVCSSCELKVRCPVKVGKKVATLHINQASYVGASRHHKYMNDSDYRKECSTRAGAEGMVSELVRKHGLRKSRHKTETRTKLQMIFGALACNVKRFLRHSFNSAHLEPETA